MRMSLRVFLSNSKAVYAAPTGGEKPDLGELFVRRSGDRILLLKVVGHEYVSTIRAETLAAMSREWDSAEPVQLTYDGSPTTFVARLKPLAELVGGKLRTVRSGVPPGAELVKASAEDLGFIERSSGVFLGYVRSGYNVLPVRLKLDSERFVTEHVLVAASTGRGKSNLLKVLLWSLLDSPKIGVFVVDPHREYYPVLIDHPNAQENLVCFSPNPKPGEAKLAVSTELIRPYHLVGAISLSEAQEREADLLYREHKEKWIQKLVEENKEASGEDSQGARLARETLSRKLVRLLSIDAAGPDTGVFRRPDRVRRGDVDGLDFLDVVFEEVEAGKVVVVDTSSLSADAELLIGNMVAYKILDEHIRRRQSNEAVRPVGFVLEEAPRVLGKEASENAYIKLAREGRKFGIGLIAVTQLISVIPEEILANMNTKIYLGMASGRERKAAIDNALHDMSDEEDELLRLDVGEAIVTSTSLGFPVPIKIPLIDSLKKEKQETLAKPSEKLV